MYKTAPTTLIVLVFCLQLFVPARMIFRQENTLKTGVPYKFKTRPIDPNDPFRGKYITLNYEANSFKTNENGWENYSGMVYVYLFQNEAGFAQVKTVSKTPLDLPEDYIIAQSNYTYNCTIYFELPFNRFYMNENKAYDAEISVMRAQRDSLKNCYGLVYLKDGIGVLDNVFIDGMDLKKYVKAYQKEKH